jgi:hypothetical protein
MSDDETQPVSGSRWEQPADPNTQPAVPPPTPPTPPTPSYAPAPPPNRNRGRLLLAGGAVGVALIAGAGGVALGHATAGDDRDAGVGRTGFGPNGGPGQGFPNNGQPPPGFQGGPGGQDDQDGFDPRGDDDDDGDDDGADDGDDDGDDLPDDDSTQGSSNS